MGQKVDRRNVLVETPDIGDPTIRNGLLECCDLVTGVIPEHDTDRDTTTLNQVGRVAIPEQDLKDVAGRNYIFQPRVIVHSPSDTKLCTTAGAGSVGGNGIRRLGGRRRWAVVRRGGALGSARRLVSGSARWLISGGGGGRPGFALPVALATLLPGNPVVIWNLPSQMVRLHCDGEGLGGSERAEEDSEGG